MTVADLVGAMPLDRSMQLAQVSALRSQVEDEGEHVSDITRTELSRVVGGYLTDGGENAAALRAMLASISRPERHGGAFYLHGVAGSGKTHTLGLMSLLVESQRARDEFAATHPGMADLCQALADADPLLVVMSDLAAHRGQEDQLEDVIFECTEGELRRPRYGTDVRLTELSHALHLIDRHLVPGHREGLDAAVAERVPGFESWEHLRAENPAGAVRIARVVVRDVGLPLDFRQSRVERLAALLEAVRTLDLRGVLWLVDGLSAFLAGAGPRGMSVDWDFLHFLAQRAKITPLWMVVSLRHSPQSLAETHPYAVGEVETHAEGSFGLSSSHMRRIVAGRVVERTDEEAFAKVVGEIHAAHARRTPQEPFSEERLAESYPLHPLTQQCLESVCTRLFGEVTTLADFTHAVIVGDATRGVAPADQRPAGDLVTPAEAYDYVEAQIAQHPDVSVYVYDVVDYFARNAKAVVPGDEGMCIAAAKALTLCRLANLAPTTAALADALFPASQRPELPVAGLAGVLERMRIKGRHIEVRRQPGEGADLYRADARTTFADAIRRRLAAMKATIDDDDARLREYILPVASDPGLPLSELAAGPWSQEVEWQNTTRYVSIEAANLAAMQAGDLTDALGVLSDPSSLEDCLIYVADIIRSGAQRDRWLALAGELPQTRWAAGLVLWAPRPLTDQELDALKSGLACRMLLAEPGLASNAEAQGLRTRLEEERAALDQEARAVAAGAYYEGEVLTNRGVVISAEELKPVRGDWAATVTAMAAPALSRLFPGFPPAAPTTRLEGVEQTDALVEQFILPASAPVDEDTPLDGLIRSIAIPLGIARREGDRYELQAEGSAARALLEYIDRRDRSPDRSLAFDCVDLALHMLKSEVGLPGELFELVVATLLRTGHLTAVDQDGVPMPWRRVQPPIRQGVSRLMQAPLLAMQEWQEVGRLARAVLGSGVISPSRATQESLWDEFLEARERHARRGAVIKVQLQELSARLGQDGSSWEETRQALSTLDTFFARFDDNLPAAAGLKEVVAQTAPYLKASGGRVRLRTLLDFAEDLDDFLKGPAQDLISSYEYLNDPSLTIEEHSELIRIRNRLLSYLQSGERLFADRTALNRTSQAFMAAYRRAYLQWHAAQHRDARFSPYQAFRESAEYGALERLSRVAIEVDVDKNTVDTMLDDQLAQRCAASGLAEALNDRPTCPRCGLRLDDEIRLQSAEQIREATIDAIAAYITQVTSAEVSASIHVYAETLAPGGEIRRALNQVLALRPTARAREVLALFTEDVIAHLNRALGGQFVHSRRLDVLAARLVDRTLTREEIERILGVWLDGDDEIRDGDLVVVDG